MCASHVLEPNEISQIVTSYQIVCGNKSEITREKRIWREKKRTQHNNNSSSINNENFTAVMHLYWVVALNSKSIGVNRFQLCFRNRRHLITAETQSDDRIPIWRNHLSKLFDTFVTFENETRKTLWGLSVEQIETQRCFFLFYNFCFCKWIPKRYHFKERSFEKSLHHDIISKRLIDYFCNFFLSKTKVTNLNYIKFLFMNHRGMKVIKITNEQIARYVCVWKSLNEKC